MTLYADTPGRRTWQLATDLLVVAWLWFWIWLATKLYSVVLKLGVPGQKLTGAGDGMANGLADAGAKAHRVPVAGDQLAEPFAKAADAARAIADAGRDEQHAVHQLAWIAALLLVSVPVAVVLFGWLPLRLRWIRRATAAAAWRGSGSAGNDLLALRALTNQPLSRLLPRHPTQGRLLPRHPTQGRLSTVDPDPVAAWRRGDPETVAALAALELRRLGLRGRPG
jgi:hypothetical protein